MERRFSKTHGVSMSTRAGDDPKATVLVGYAAVYYDGTPETEYTLWRGAVERIIPGAFDRAIAENDDVRALFNHDSALLLGRTPQTLALSSDKVGLRYAINLGDTSIAKDVAQHVGRGDVSGSSFAFQVEREEWVIENIDDEDSTEIRNILSVRLFDVGPVTYPAYDATTAEANAERSDGDNTDARTARDDWVRRNGINRRARNLELSLDVERMSG